MSNEYEKEGEDREKSKPCSQESIGGFKLFGFHIDLGESTIKKSKSLSNLPAFGNNNNDADDEDDDVIKKSRSLDNLQTFNNSKNDASGYTSEGLINKSSRAHYRKRGTPWTEEEHRSFLMGLDRLGRGDWKGIAKKFVPSRKPTQIASHAQKYFLRLANNKEKRRRRSSVFDIPHPSNEQSQAAHGSPSNQSPESSKQVFNLAASMNNTSEMWAKAIVPSSERPPLSPMKCNTITEFLETTYAPRLSSYNQAFASQSILMPTLPWGPVFNFSAQSSALTMPNFSGGLPNCGAFVPQKTQLNGSSQVGPKTSDDELNLNIRKLTLM